MTAPGFENTGDGHMPGSAEEKKFLSDLILRDGVSDIHLTVIPETRSEGLAWVRSGGGIEQPVRVFIDLELENSEWENDKSAELIVEDRRLRIAKRLSSGVRQYFIRVLPKFPLSIRTTNGEAIVREYPRPKSGMILIAGPTGSGKTTFMASIIQHYLDTQPIHIVTIEDPLEYEYRDSLGHISRRQIGRDVEAFDVAVSDAMREDPDIILIGEIRDPVTAQTAITAAETGHMVFATVHAGSIPGIVERYLGLLDNDPYQSLRLSLALNGCVCMSEDEMTGDRKVDVEWMRLAHRSLIRERRTHQWQTINSGPQKPENPWDGGK